MGWSSYRHANVEIPRRSGIDRTVGDTVGPRRGVRFLRSVPAYEQSANDALEVCPNATFINYANPMAMATAYLNAKGLRTVGLCHSVQGTTRMLARTLGVPSRRCPTAAPASTTRPGSSSSCTARRTCTRGSAR